MTASPAGRQIGLHREMPHPGVGLGHRHNRPGLQGVGVGFEDGEEPAEHPLRPHVPQPEDDDARSGGAGNGNQVREVEVVGDEDSRFGARASRSRDPSAGNLPGRQDARRQAQKVRKLAAVLAAIPMSHSSFMPGLSRSAVPSPPRAKRRSAVPG